LGVRGFCLDALMKGGTPLVEGNSSIQEIDKLPTEMFDPRNVPILHQPGVFQFCREPTCTGCKDRDRIVLRRPTLRRMKKKQGQHNFRSAHKKLKTA